MGLSLITLAEYKAYAGITSTNSDSEVNVLIPQVSNYIKQYCNRDFIDWVDEDKVQYSNGGDPVIYLNESPTIQLKSVEWSSDYGQTWTTLTQYADYVLDTQYDRLQVLNPSFDYPTGTGSHRAVYKSGEPAVFPFYQNGYRITYNAGFEELPPDVKLAALELVKYYLKSDTAVKGAGNVGRNNAVIEYITNGKLPSSIARLLDYWVQDCP